MKNPNKLFENAYNAYLNNDYSKSEKLYRKLLKMNPEWDATATIYYNLGLTLMSLNRFTEALKCFNKSYNMNQGVENIWNKCLCLLNLKRFDEAMKYFNGRYMSNNKDNITATSFPNLPIPQLDDLTLAKDKNILILNEQGLGDEMMFTTQLIHLDKIVKSAKVQVSEHLIDMFNQIYSFENIEFSSFQSISFDEIHDFDCFAGLGSVFSTFYNKTSLSLNEFNASGNKKVGVCWATNRKSPNTHLRSIDSSILKDIKYDLVNLQFGENYGKELDLNDFTPSNFLETWNLLDTLDAIVTVDTSIAHLAGLKNIPTILLINKHLDWRWKFRDEEYENYSMFYPMVEIVEIDKEDNITETINTILDELL